MTFDGILLNKICLELSSSIGQQLRQVYQTSKTNFYLKFSKSSIQFSLNSVFPFVSAGRKDPEDGNISSPLLIFMRRHLPNLFLSELTQLGMDRQVTFKLTGSNPFGEKIEYYMNIEIMGPNSNIVITDSDNMILQVFKSKITRQRTIAPGVEYTRPESRGVPLMKLSSEEFFEKLTLDRGNIDKGLLEVLQGFPRNTVQIVMENAGLGVSQFEELTELQTDSLWRVLMSIKADLDQPRVYVYQRDGKTDISAVGPLNAVETTILNPSAAIISLVNSDRSENDLSLTKRRVSKKLRSEIQRLDKLRDKLFLEMKEIEGCEDYKNMGELIVSNLYRLKEKVDKVQLASWVTGEEVEIILDSRLTPSENAQLFFKYYNKSKRKQIQVYGRIRELSEELKYLEQLLVMIELCENTPEIEDLKSELVAVGVMKIPSKKRVKKDTKIGPRIFKYANHIYNVGKNNFQNDEITRRASREDYWFHARGIPGAHVILKTSGMEPTEAEIVYGAGLAARYSRGKMSLRVEVDCAKVADVWKPRGAKPGMVRYRNSRTLNVKPVEIKDEEVVG